MLNKSYVLLKESELILDKYYTSDKLAEYVVNQTIDIIGLDNITEFLEPSAGNGVFLEYLNKPFLAYDIQPEGDNIIKQDFLKLNMPYKKGRVVIGNPPFGRANSTLKQFYKKAVKLGDYISFILPISQYKNNYELYDFDLVHSEDLGIQTYSNIDKHCCLNIYQKPHSPKKKPKHKYKDMEIVGWRKAKQTTCDFYICCYGSPLGKFVEKDSDLVNINGIIVHNDHLKDKIYEVFATTDWEKEYSMMSSPNLLQWQMYKVLKREIPELK